MTPDNQSPPRKPPWWPADEHWPPHGRPPWRARRGRFFWRVGCLFFGLFFLLCSAIFAATRLFYEGPPEIRHWPPGPFLAPVFFVQPCLLNVVIVLAGFISIGLIGQALRRAAITPIGDLIEAAERVAEGDYSTRVRVGGPPEVRAIARVFNSMVERLQASAEQRRNLLADVTHELRTPLTIIRGNLEGLMDGVYPADGEHLKVILAETEVLSRLIDDLRTLALAESGALTLHKTPTDLLLLAGETVASFRIQAQEAGVKITTKTAPDLPSVSVDPARIREVLANLIANALRYTPRGAAITLGFEQEENGDGEKVIAVVIQDTGSGIAPDDLPHIFDRFYRSSDSGGMGLGLAISKNLIGAHGGEVSAASEPGKGTTIRFTLPVEE